GRPAGEPAARVHESVVFGLLSRGPRMPGMDIGDSTVEARRALRRSLLAARAAIDADRRRSYEAAIAACVAQIEPLRQARTIAVYWPIRAEPELAAAYAAWRGMGQVLALPVGGGPNGGLLFCR